MADLSVVVVVVVAPVVWSKLERSEARGGGGFIVASMTRAELLLRRIISGSPGNFIIRVWGRLVSIMRT